MEQLRFDGRVVIVTGAGGGLGREHARLLASRGARVVINDLAGRDGAPSPADAVVDEIRADGGEAVAAVASIATQEGAEAIVATAIEAFGRLDALINSAGIFETRPLAETDVDNFVRHVTVNLVGTAAMCFAAWPHLVASGTGRIVNTMSSAGVLGLPSRVSYGASKSGIIGLTKCLATEGLEESVKVNLVNPSARTAMWVDPATGGEVAGVPQAPADGPDPNRAEQVSPIFAVLAHATCPTTGEMYNAGAGVVAREYFVDGAGFFDRSLTPEKIIERWHEIVDGSDPFVPTTLNPRRA
ncbi:MAG: family NAD(P)-dependent oxidoreductase [Conexibacter sp.]|nr:family NAD(P)-dependent oxidoreductase [Conexibacter sp.]